MIKKIIVVTVALFMLYFLFVISVAPKWWHASQHLAQDNNIKAQKFIYDKNDSFDNVIVGSSLSNRLFIDSIPHTYNLSFTGQSIYDGLNILTHKTVLPKNVFVEMNVALREENDNFTSTLNSPILFYSKKIFRSLRDDKQPLGIVGAQIDSRLTSRLISKVRGAMNLTPKEGETDPELFTKMLNLQLETYSKMPKADLLNRCFNKLKEYVANLESKGVNIVFFEIPVDRRLNNQPEANSIRAAFHRIFPDSKYSYIPLPADTAYETTDAIHLDEKSAWKYTFYLREKMMHYPN